MPAPTGRPQTSQESAARGRSRMVANLLGTDQPVDLLLVAATLTIFVGLDLATRALSNIPSHRLDQRSLLVEAIGANRLLFLITGVGVVVASVAWRTRFWSRWTELEHGRALRVLAIGFLFVLTWRGSLYEYNFLLDQTHVLDRALLAVFAVGSIYRPILLAPVALQSRVIAAQFAYPFGTTAGQNIDELIVIGVLILAAVHLKFVLTGIGGTSIVLLLLSAALASHFFIPGRSKMAIGWLGDNEIFNLPLSGFTAGWLGETDGGWARALSGAALPFNIVLLVSTLLLELGAGLAVIHYRLMRIWLIGAITFHLVLFAAIGFWFLSWLVMELGLLVMFFAPSLREWVATNSTPARAVLTFLLVVVAGAVVFHPPRLAWLDAPVSYGYRLEATGSSGSKYRLPASAFSPLTQELTFVRMAPSGITPAIGGYGAAGPDRFEQLHSVATRQELQMLEPTADPFVVSASGELLTRFMDYANSHGQSVWEHLAPPDHFWTGSSDQSYRFEEPLRRIDVYLLTALHSGSSQNLARRRVMTLELDQAGRARIAYRQPAVP